jgi:hypothetical protein
MTSYAGQEQVLVDLWIESALFAYTDQLEAIATGLSDRIYHDAARQGTEWPVIIYQCQTPPRVIRGVGTTTIMVDTLYVVKAVAQTLTYESIGPIAQVIDIALTSAEGGQIGGGYVLTSIRNNQFSMIEDAMGTQFRHLGGLYQINAQG